MFGKDLGIDLGTANTLVFLKNKGIVINEPSVVAVNSATNDVLAVGADAKRMIGRTSGVILAIKPMKCGVISDFRTTRAMLKYFIGKAANRRFFGARPRVIVCVPPSATDIETRAVFEAVSAGGAGDRGAYVMYEPVAAAIGAGLPVSEPVGNMIVDVGGGTSDVAVISLMNIVCGKSLHVAGNDFDEHIARYVRRERNLIIGERTAEEIKLCVGCVFDPDPSVVVAVRGRDAATGLPRTIDISQAEVAFAISEPIYDIVDAIRQTLENTPPELASDIMRSGITLTGGGALLDGLDNYIEAEIGVAVNIADEPLNCVAIGTGVALDNLRALKGALISYKD